MMMMMISRKDFEIIELTMEMLCKRKVKIKSDTSNKWGNWKHLKIIQKIPEQQTWKVHQGIT